ncbi:hypothetical protein [Mycobacteroides abscessus]|nr:hypothetical protein [Mycobacteroides abscessus]SHQ68960.1 Uncharacterised protein [Mycobacteroides abscessus subsp. abscessus]SHR27479.1 Uncharacterised protein [Mycobacteroides abscessus subsp. abscessus]SHR95596.1 Uncharacterised protein [Mycobacteroides abscessus subsp. abscessus]SHS74776.1 Uncharacterised protein [Mycobacteroides abscessus subsp. abscessus]SHT60946.1 Uncharacterised protein [Mycobacteroides abscessus subsp. abscessus]
MTSTQMEAIRVAIRGAFAHLSDAEVAQLALEPYIEFQQQALPQAA